jgi:hypothetical protein
MKSRPRASTSSNKEFTVMSIFKNNFVIGITAGLAASVIAPVLIPALKRGSRPLAKSLVKGGIILYDKGREAVAGAGEMMEDVIAEVRAEAYEKHASSMADSDGDTVHHADNEQHGGNLSSVKNGPAANHSEEGKEGGTT